MDSCVLSVENHCEAVEQGGQGDLNVRVDFGALGAPSHSDEAADQLLKFVSFIVPRALRLKCRYNIAISLILSDPALDGLVCSMAVTLIGVRNGEGEPGWPVSGVELQCAL
jgi:hypothetical protein